MKFFVEQGVDPNQEDLLLQLPIYYAVREGHSQVIDLLLNKMKNVNHLDTYGQTAIFYCVREGNIVTA